MNPRACMPVTIFAVFRSILSPVDFAPNMFLIFIN